MIGSLELFFKLNSTITAVLYPTFWSKGIASAAVSTFIQAWIIPHVPSCTEIVANIFEDNIGSIRTFIKAGFVLDEEKGSKTSLIVQPENKGGKTHKQVVVVWKRPV